MSRAFQMKEHPVPTIIKNTPEVVVSPMVLADQREEELIVSGEYAHTRFQTGVTYSVEMRSTFINAAGSRGKSPIVETVVADGDGRLVLPFHPDIGGEWAIQIESETDIRRHFPATVAVYVLPEGLSGYRPYIGELHAHSTSSDGKQEPAYPPMRARTYGYDFFALTDHWCYESSNEMIRVVGDSLGEKMLLLRGEEMHPEREILLKKAEDQEHSHHYHYVAIGHSKSVRDAFLADETRSHREVEAIGKELEGRGVDSRVDLNHYAEGVWKIRKAREFGGIVVYAHPYWATPVNLDIGAIEQTFCDREFDAVEAISRADGSSYMTNKLLAISGSDIPAVGVSDSHDWHDMDPQLFFTFVMAKDLSHDSVFDAIRTGRSVACHMADPFRLVGPFELAEFATFYLHQILPKRRRIMSLQGHLALSKLRGGAYSQDLIDRLDADLSALDRSIWGVA